MLTKQQIPSVTDEMLDYLQKTFRPLEISPTNSIEEIMYNAGQQEVVRWLEAHKRNSTMLGDINATRQLT